MTAMLTKEPKPRWLEWCPSCKRKHLVTIGKCSSCRVYGVPEIVSEHVADRCHASTIICDGCQSYEERYL
jgi:hypothetical protein